MNNIMNLSIAKKEKINSKGNSKVRDGARNGNEILGQDCKTDDDDGGGGETKTTRSV